MTNWREERASNSMVTEKVCYFDKRLFFIFSILSITHTFVTYDLEEKKKKNTNTKAKSSECAMFFYEIEG